MKSSSYLNLIILIILINNAYIEFKSIKITQRKSNNLYPNKQYK